MYVLKHGSHWVCDPDAHMPESPNFPPRLDLCQDPDCAWRIRDLDVALEKAKLMQMIRGWHCQVQHVASLNPKKGEDD